WTQIPPNDNFTTAGFGARTIDTSGSRVTYRGNIGDPWGSNIIRIPSTSASNYKYVLKMSRGSDSPKPWTVIFWNKVGPSGQLDGWYGHSALNFTLEAHESAYVAFDENSQGAWGAAEGTELPKDKFGGYSCTWGEFDFGNAENGGWSGWDVSAIQAQEAGQVVQGMRICDHAGKRCSYVTEGAREVVNAYTRGEKKVDGIGGNGPGGAVRLEVLVDYRG
ncbi:allergen Asp f 4, partial [Aspergillus campestris IBT 28561]